MPSATEAIYALGLEDELYGVTHECDYPKDARSKPRLTKNKLKDNASSNEIDKEVRNSLGTGEGIYELDFENLAMAAPDIIFTQELCKVCAVPYGEIHRASMKLSKNPKIVSLDTFSLSEILVSIKTIGSSCGRNAEAARFVESLESRIERVTNLVLSTRLGSPPKSVFFMEWINPAMSCGHWMPEIISRAGGKDVMGVHGENSKRVEWNEVVKASPEFLVIAPCGFGVEKAGAEARQLSKLKGWKEIRAVRESKVFVSDGNAYFSRPGPRIVDGLEILASILHPELTGNFGNSYGEKDYRRAEF
ncbi:MAG: cobalamin-binding protein [Nitrososphaerales archaeon]